MYKVMYTVHLDCPRLYEFMCFTIIIITDLIID